MTRVTSNSARGDCTNCGRVLRGSKEVHYCEDCMFAYKKGEEETKQKMIKDEIKFLENIRTALFKNSQITFDNKSIIFSLEYFDATTSMIDKKLEELNPSLEGKEKGE